MLKRTLTALALTAVIAGSTPALAQTYVIDTQGAHASINFKVKHLGYSWLAGRFDKFSGSFNFDEANPATSSVKVEIDTTSVNSNHAERDKHLRSGDFLNVEKHPTAVFESTAIEVAGDGKGVITGNLTLNGITKPVAIEAAYIGGGKDPWGGFRQGFVGTTRFALADFGMTFDLGPASREVELELHIEGIKQ